MATINFTKAKEEAELADPIILRSKLIKEYKVDPDSLPGEDELGGRASREVKTEARKELVDCFIKILKERRGVPSTQAEERAKGRPSATKRMRSKATTRFGGVAPSAAGGERIIRKGFRTGRSR